MVVIYVQEIGQVTEAKDMLLTLRTRQESRLDVIIRAEYSFTSPPSSNPHQPQSVHNPELRFGRFGRLCQFKKIADLFFTLLDWHWEILGGITRHTRYA